MSSKVGPGGDEHELAQQGSRRTQHRVGRFDDVVGLGEPAFADPAAGQIAFARFDEADAARAERRHVGAHRVVVEHVGVHRRCHQDWRPRGQVERRQEVVGNAVRKFADDVGGRRNDEQQLRVRRERDVLDVGICALGELIGDHAPVCDRLEGDGADEAPGRAGHDRRHVVAALLQSASDLDGLVGADAAAYAEGDQGHECYRSSASGWSLRTLPSVTSACARRGELGAAGRLRRAALEQLAGARARDSHELEGVANL